MKRDMIDLDKAPALIRVVVIDPQTMTLSTPLTDGGPQGFLPGVQALLGPHVKLVANVQVGPGLVLWIDALGFLRQEQWFWSFKGEEAEKIAGRGVVTAIDEDGVPSPVLTRLDPDTIVWHPWTRIKGVVQSIELQPAGVDGAQYPVLTRRIEWAEPEPAAPPAPEPPAAPPAAETPEPAPEPAPAPQSGAGMRVWLVIEQEDGLFHAQIYDVKGNRMRADPTSVLHVAPNLDELRRLLPPGLNRLDPADTDAPDIVELWL